MLTMLLVTCASSLLESTPFILAAALLGAVLRQNARMAAYLACGCGSGPSARSLPAAAATLVLFGPLVAAARLLAAIGVEHLLLPKRGCPQRCAHVFSPLVDLHALAPLAALGASAAILLPAIAGMHAPPILAFAGGALAGFILAPCALGGVSIAAALRAVLPAASAGFLCVAGIVDLRAWLSHAYHAGDEDLLAYLLAALACAIVAAHQGAGLLHPLLALTLWPCSALLLVRAYRAQTKTCARMRIAPAIMLAGAVLGAPLPQYHATQTTLSDAFAGEHVDFTGELTRTGRAVTLVRYAITCCRADASPIVLRLDRAPRLLHGWAHASGVLIAHGDTLQLHVNRIAAITPPADPFVYR